ncbi:MAG TPA: M48 family metalloprotease [Gemmataceae bacterium]|nr:M48 family metalloprotease [Gemmataceae bacterium]
MRSRLPWMLMLLAGCVSTPQLAQIDSNTTQQVGSTPFHEPSGPRPTRVNYAPASREVEYRVLQMKDKLLNDNLRVTIKPVVVAISSTDPEVFHVGAGTVYVTDALVKQCSDAQLAAVLANEMGKMISEREQMIADQIRAPEPLTPINLPIGGPSSMTDINPLGNVELGRYEQRYPKTVKKLPAPNPQQVARSILEGAGFRSTDLDAAQPILQVADRNGRYGNQFSSPAKQSDWKMP